MTGQGVKPEGEALAPEDALPLLARLSAASVLCNDGFLGLRGTRPGFAAATRSMSPSWSWPPRSACAARRRRRRALAWGRSRWSPERGFAANSSPERRRAQRRREGSRGARRSHVLPHGDGRRRDHRRGDARSAGEHASRRAGSACWPSAAGRRRPRREGAHRLPAGGPHRPRVPRLRRDDRPAPSRGQGLRARVPSGGIQVAMVTGDHPITALAIARELGLADSPSRS